MAVEVGSAHDNGVSEKETLIVKKGGVLLLVDALTGKIFVQEDAADKAGTGRKKGEISVPIETRKEGEEPHTTLLGGLAEVFDDFDHEGEPVMPRLSQRLFTVDPGYITGDEIPYLDPRNGRQYVCNPFVVIYDGEPINGSPLDAHEAIPRGWVSPSQFLQTDNARPVAQHVVSKLVANGVIQDRLDTYRQRPDLRVPVIPPDFSLRQHCEVRERNKDIKIEIPVVERYNGIPQRQEVGGEFYAA